MTVQSSEFRISQCRFRIILVGNVRYPIPIYILSVDQCLKLSRPVKKNYFLLFFWTDTKGYLSKTKQKKQNKKQKTKTEKRKEKKKKKRYLKHTFQKNSYQNPNKTKNKTRKKKKKRKKKRKKRVVCMYMVHNI